MKISKGSSGPKVPGGTHVARCFTVIDLGTQTSEGKFGVTQKRKLLIGFELPEELHTFDDAKGPQPFSVWGRYTASLHEKSQLRPLLEGWRGKPFTREEEAGFEVKNLLGAPALVTIVHEGEYANINSIVKLPKSTTCPPAVNPPVFISLDADEWDEKDFLKLSPKLQETIAKSPEYQRITGSGPKSETTAPDPSDYADANAAAPDDIPFSFVPLVFLLPELMRWIG